jgi:membrane protein YqaA with SNARE-associated domain
VSTITAHSYKPYIFIAFITKTLRFVVVASGLMQLVFV